MNQISDRGEIGRRAGRGPIAVGIQIRFAQDSNTWVSVGSRPTGQTFWTDGK